jgi:hypothetical protein
MYEAEPRELCTCWVRVVEDQPARSSNWARSALSRLEAPAVRRARAAISSSLRTEEEGDDAPSNRIQPSLSRAYTWTDGRDAGWPSCYMSQRRRLRMGTGSVQGRSSSSSGVRTPCRACVQLAVNSRVYYCTTTTTRDSRVVPVTRSLPPRIRVTGPAKLSGRSFNWMKTK